MHGKLVSAQNKVRNLEDAVPVAMKIDNLITLLLNYLSHVNNLLPEDVMDESRDVGDKVHRFDNYR